jgi:hypothetical protein
MRIYLDTKDLINLIEKSFPCNTEDFDNKLRPNGYQLVISFANILEISAPLLHDRIGTKIMGLLNKIEKLPIIFIKADVIALELSEAIKAYEQSREYNHINPFVNSFDEVLISPPMSKYSLKRSLSETMFMMWNQSPDIFRGFNQYSIKLKNVLDEDRAVKKHPELRDHFFVAVARSLKMSKLAFPQQELSKLAQWIYESTSRCPSMRVRYEVYHKLRQNKTDTVKCGDIADFSHMDYLPYVDMITLDRRMATYAKRVCSDLRLDLRGKIYKSIQEILIHI